MNPSTATPQNQSGSGRESHRSMLDFQQGAEQGGSMGRPELSASGDLGGHANGQHDSDPAQDEALEGIDLREPPPRTRKHSDREYSALITRWAFDSGFWAVVIAPKGAELKLRSGTKISEGKEPLGKGWGLNRLATERMAFWRRTYPDAGVGICLGPGRAPDGLSWLADFEIDGDGGLGSLAALLGGEVIASFGWTSTRGIHLILVIDGDRLLALMEAAGGKEGRDEKIGVWHLDCLPGLEIRIGGLNKKGVVKQVQSVIPPTAGTDGKPREFNTCWNIAKLPEAAYDFLEDRAEKLAIEAEGNGLLNEDTNRVPVWDTTVVGGGDPVRKPKGLKAKVTTRKDAYVEATIKNTAARVAALPRGECHNGLARESMLLMSYAKGAGEPHIANARAALLEANRLNGHAAKDPGDGEELIESAVEKATPADLSEFEKDKGAGKPGGKKRKANPTDRNGSAAGLYFEKGSLYVVGEDGPEILANFTARITENITRHEGGEEKVRFQIEAKHSVAAIGPRTLTVGAEKYGAMSWVFGLGAEFAISAGRDRKDHTRCAIQLLSQKDDVRSVVEHTSLGWVRHEGKWLYVHAGGAIDPDGDSGAVLVDIPAALGVYRLPTPPTDPETIRRAIEAHLQIWELAKSDRPGSRAIAAIVATLPTRAVVSAFDASVHVGGPTGNRKTSVSRLALQHFSAVVKGRNHPMPAGWRDTSNALQRLLFDDRDSLLVIDDLKTEKQVETAEIVFQAQGNLQNRIRMNLDQSLQKSLPPRGSLLSTGEIDPRTQSTLGRTLMVEIRADDIDQATLSRLQQAGDAGLYALAMASCIRWLAPQLDEIRAEHCRTTAFIREEIGDIPGAHPRHPDIIAQLIAAYGLFLRFATEARAISHATADAYVATARNYLVELARDQVELQEEAKAGRRFLELVAAALRSKRYHLADANSHNSPRMHTGACGWHMDWLYQGTEGQMPEWKIPANSKLLGFIDEIAGIVYLIPTEATAVATEMARRHNNPQSFASVGRELLNEGLCVAHEEDGKKRATAHKRIIQQAKARYLWIPVKNIFGDEEMPSDPEKIGNPGDPFVPF